MRILETFLALALALIASLSLAAGANAKSRDRNHDRIPDRWEHRHHLSLKAKQTRRDQDKDGLNNLGEYRAKTNPRDEDSDEDGIEDGDEHAGRIASFEGDVLTISLAGGGELSGKVTDDTEVECSEREHGLARASLSRHGDDESDDDEGGEHESDDGDDEKCGAEALTVGTQVHEAQLELSGGRRVWTELELVAG